MMTATPRRRSKPALTLLATVAVALTVTLVPGPAVAAPSTPGNEGGTPLLRDVIESVSRKWVKAKNALDKSRKQQNALAADLAEAEQRIAELTPEVEAVASSAYRNGRLGPMAILLNSSSPDNFLERAVQLDLMTMRDDGKLRELNAARERAAHAKVAIDAAVAEEKKQLKTMDREKKRALAALDLAGGAPTGGYVVATSPKARAAPRNPDGSWPGESCSVNDPTTSGCITPRTLHAMKEAKRVGFTKYVACWRPGDRWEHPKGRACDFSVTQHGFGGAAQGDNKLYGNNLAAFFVRNADRLGVLYVIWYRRVWLPATGWKWYSGVCGDPSCDHTNHVHLSVI